MTVSHKRDFNAGLVSYKASFLNSKRTDRLNTESGEQVQQVETNADLVNGEEDMFQSITVKEKLAGSKELQKRAEELQTIKNKTLLKTTEKNSLIERIAEMQAEKRQTEK